MSKSKSTESSEDVERLNMLWTSEHEVFLLKIKEDSKNKSIKQNQQYKKFKKIYYALAIPNVILPLSLAALNPLFLNISTVNIIGAASTSVIAGLLGLANLNERLASHLLYRERFNQLVNEIELILIKKKKDREPADVTLEKIKSLYDHLSELSPD
jgi:hypothetical protein